MSLERIVLADDAVGVWVTDEHGRRPAEPGEALGFDALAAALREHTTAEVVVCDGLPARREPGTALVVPGGMLREVVGERGDGPDLAAQAVLAAASRTTMLDTLERHGLAAAVEQGVWHAWRSARAQPTQAAITGRLEVGAAMGARVTSTPPFASTRYGPIASDEHPALPAVLAAYLTAYFAHPPRG